MSVHGHGARWLVLTLLLQGAILAIPRPSPPPASLAAAAVVEPAIGGAPSALSARSVVPAGGRLQLTFAPGAPGFAAVLWFDGDGLVSLYPDPNLAQSGATEARSYALPAPDAWLRLTPSQEEEFLAVVTSPHPDPEILATLADPSPGRVRALRARLERLADARQSSAVGVERHLPTADGRAVAVPWRRIQGEGPLVLGWRITVESSAWLAPNRSSSSAQGSPARSSPSAS